MVSSVFVKITEQCNMHVEKPTYTLNWDSAVPLASLFSISTCGVTAGRGGEGRVAPWHFSLESFCWPTGKRETRKKGKVHGNFKIEGEKKSENKQRTPPPFSLFETTETCLGSARMGISTWRGISHQEKIRKNYFAPWKILLLHHWIGPCLNYLLQNIL